MEGDDDGNTESWARSKSAEERYKIYLRLAELYPSVVGALYKLLPSKIQTLIHSI